MRLRKGVQIIGYMVHRTSMGEGVAGQEVTYRHERQTPYACLNYLIIWGMKNNIFSILKIASSLILSE